MRIAQIAPLVERVPPHKYGGTERVVHALTEELVRRGHEVTLFAAGGSETSATLVSVYPRALREANMPDLYGSNHLTLLNIGVAYSRAGEFDVIHDHMVPLSLPTANVSPTPVIATIHGAFDATNKRLFEALRHPHIVTISKAQGLGFPNINHAGTVYNGLDMRAYPFFEAHGEYLLNVGRISMEKGTHLAVEVAQQLDMPLVIAAKLDAHDRPYFRDFIEPWLSDRIRWIGEVDEAERNRLMSKARCLLHPVTWREPFGLVLIEAMACGCPVVGLDLGSVPEIVRQGETGFVAHDLEGLIDAVVLTTKLDRTRCRDVALSEFSAERMADGYEQLFMNLAKK